MSGRERWVKASKGKARQGENERRGRGKGRARVEGRKGEGGEPQPGLFPLSPSYLFASVVGRSPGPLQVSLGPLLHGGSVTPGWHCPTCQQVAALRGTPVRAVGLGESVEGSDRSS